MVCSSSLSLAIPCLCDNIAFEGETRALPEPFFVIATQNPLEQSGTHPLPESQLDRFLMRMELGYPDAAAERGMLQSMGRGPQAMRLAADPRHGHFALRVGWPVPAGQRRLSGLLSSPDMLAVRPRRPRQL